MTRKRRQDLDNALAGRNQVGGGKRGCVPNYYFGGDSGLTRLYGDEEGAGMKLGRNMAGGREDSLRKGGRLSEGAAGREKPSHQLE